MPPTRLKKFQRLFPNCVGVEVNSFSKCYYHKSSRSCLLVHIRIFNPHTLLSPAYILRPVHDYFISTSWLRKKVFLFLHTSVWRVVWSVTCPIRIRSVLVTLHQMGSDHLFNTWPCLPCVPVRKHTMAHLPAYLNMSDMGRKFSSVSVSLKKHLLKREM